MPTHPTCRLKVSLGTAKFIKQLHPELKRKIKFALHEIITNPSAGKSLKDELFGLRSYRIKKIRIIYRICADKIIELVTIGPRKSIYEETFRIISRE
jgi:mRNA interferase RelE/StbE